MSANDVERFHQHLSACQECGESPDGVHCEEGVELLLEAAEELSEDLQHLARRIYRKQELQREADENFRFYAGMEEF